MKVRIEKSKRKNKRFVAIFEDGRKTHFGLRGGSTYIDHQDKTKRKNYLKRHVVRENWDDFQSAGSLSRFLLWNKTTFNSSLKDYKKRFKLT